MKRKQRTVLHQADKEEADLGSPARERLIAVVQDYMKCDSEGRHHIESMAEAFAAKAKK